MPPSRSVPDPRTVLPAHVATSANVETFRRLQELSEEVGVHLDLRPGTVTRTLVDGLLNFQDEHEIVTRRMFSALGLPSHLLEGSLSTPSWDVQETLGEMVVNSEAVPMRRLMGRNEFQRLMTRQAQEDAVIFEQMDRIATEGFDPRTPMSGQVLQYNGGSASWAPTDPGFSTRGDLSGSYSDFIELSYVRDPLDSQTRIRGERVTLPEFELAANPTVSLGAITARRFDLIDRVQAPMPPPPLPFDMVAHLLRPTSWEHLLVEDPF